jgi:hypothetical protein
MAGCANRAHCPFVVYTYSARPWPWTLASACRLGAAGATGAVMNRICASMGARFCIFAWDHR